MSFSQTVKGELIDAQYTEPCCRKAFLYGMCLFGKSFSSRQVALQTENPRIAEKYSVLLAEICRVEAAVVPSPGRRSFTVSVTDGTLRKVGIALFKRKLFEYDAAKAAFFKHEGNIIEGAGVKVFNNAFFRNVAEQPDLCADAAIERIITAANEDIRLNTDTLQFFDGMLSGLCFQLTGRRKVRNERNMDKAALILRKLSFKLANSLKEGLGFNVADGSADFNKHDLGFDCVDGLLDAELDFVRDMRNHLHRAALVAAAAFAVENCGINLSGGGVVELCELFVNKTFVPPMDVRNETLVSGFADSVLLIWLPRLE